VVYPLQKEQELKLEEINLLMKVEKISSEITALNKDIVLLDSVEAGAKKEINKIKALQLSGQIDSLTSEIKIAAVKLDFENKKSPLSKKALELDLKNIESKYEIQKHDELCDQIRSYTIFKIVFIGGGILFIILGFRFWLSSTFIDETEKCKNITPPYSSSFLRIRLRLRKILKMP
jgi:hypothetical protein